MIIQMKVELSGTRNGESWPARGGTIELPDHEGAKLCNSGLAIPVPDQKTETATAPQADVEKRFEGTSGHLVPGHQAPADAPAAKAKAKAKAKPASRKPGTE